MQVKRRYQLHEEIKFGMLFGYKIWDRQKEHYLPYDFSEDEKGKALTKMELKEALNNN